MLLENSLQWKYLILQGRWVFFFFFLLLLFFVFVFFLLFSHLWDKKINVFSIAVWDFSVSACLSHPRIQLLSQSVSHHSDHTHLHKHIACAMQLTLSLVILCVLICHLEHVPWSGKLHVFTSHDLPGWKYGLFSSKDGGRPMYHMHPHAVHDSFFFFAVGHSDVLCVGCDLWLWLFFDIFILVWLLSYVKFCKFVHIKHKKYDLHRYFKEQWF